MAQTGKSPPEMQETWVQLLGGQDPQVSMAADSSTLTWRIPMERGAWWATVHGVVKSQTRLRKDTHTANGHGIAQFNLVS